jgi:hypothetical protein
VATPPPPVTPTPEPTPTPTEEPTIEPVPTPEPVAATTPDVELPEPPAVSPVQVAGGVASFAMLGLAAALRRRMPR